MAIETELMQLFTESKALPFLFMARILRLFGFEDWKGLIRHSEEIDRNSSIIFRGDGSLPKAAKLLSLDYHEKWWTLDNFQWPPRLSQFGNSF